MHIVVKWCNIFISQMPQPYTATVGKEGITDIYIYPDTNCVEVVRNGQSIHYRNFPFVFVTGEENKIITT